MTSHLKIRGQGKSDPIIILKVNDKRFTYRTFIHSTGIVIQANIWDKRKGRVRIVPGRELEISGVNQYLDRLEQAVNTYLGHRHGSSTLNVQEFKTHIASIKIDEQKIESDKTEKQNSFFAQWQNFIDTAKNPSGVKITQGTRNSKTQTLTLVKAYCEEKKFKLTFENLDMDFYHKFNAYMEEKDFEGNTRGKHFKEIKAIMREAEDRDIVVNRAFTKKSFKVIRTSPDNIYLSDKELKKIYNHKFSKELAQHRDIFIMACFVGARHGDWCKITSANIVVENNKDILKYKQEKTGEIVHLPVHSIVRRIIDQYKGELPKVISNQKFNKALKRIGSKAELGNVVINDVSVDKGSEITTHTARRSFATNAYLSKALDVHQIMKCTGHRSESSFLRYLKLNGRDFAMEAADSKFFNDKTWKAKKGKKETKLTKAKSD